MHMRHKLSASTVNRFFAKVLQTDKCWEWVGKRLPRGYGQIRVGSQRNGTRRMEYAHRLSWLIHVGPIPDALFVCHTCDNPACVRPTHLFLGTAKDNMRDMDRKGRRVNAPPPKGTILNAKLTKAGVHMLRDAYDAIPTIGAYRKRGEVRKLFQRFHISESQLHNIVTNKCWI